MNLSDWEVTDIFSDRFICRHKYTKDHFKPVFLKVSKI